MTGSSQVAWPPIIFLVLMWAPWLICALVVRLPWVTRTPPPPAGYDVRPLSVYEVAYLAGGVKRVVSSVIAALVERGHLLIERRDLTPVGPRPADPVERAVADAAADESGFYPVLGIIKRVRASDPIRSLATDLERRGLVAPYRRVRTVRQVRKWLCLAMLLVGVGVWTAGSLSDSDAEAIGVLLCAQVLMTVIAWYSAKTPSQPPSPSGRQLLKTMRSRATDPQLAGAAGAVALGGFANYPDAEVRAALMALSPSGSGGGDSDGGDGGE